MGCGSQAPISEPYSRGARNARAFLLVEELTREYIDRRIYDFNFISLQGMWRLVGRVREDRTDLSLRFCALTKESRRCASSWRLDLAGDVRCVDYLQRC